MPEVDEGRPIERRGEVILDVELGHDVGDVVHTGGLPFTVVGVADGVSYLFGVSTMFVSLPDAQAVGAGGERAVSAIVTQGELDGSVPDGLVRYGDEAVISDLNRVVGQGFSAVQTMRVIMMIAALGVVALIIYLSALERVRDVAVLKATGAGSGFIAAGLAIQGVLVTALATGAAVVLARFLEPLFPLRLELTAGVHAELVALALLSGLLASLVGIRRVLTVDPVIAFE
jgi:putative ABC transport system permease protein